MAKIVCILPNASTSINGVTFVADRGQMISEEVSDDVAAHFARINGFKLVGAPKPKGKPADTTTGPAAAPVADEKESAS